MAQRSACLKRGQQRTYWTAANKSYRPGTPLSSYDPRSENFRPVPATRSVTTLDTRTSFEPDCAITRAAAWTAMPPMSRPMSSRCERPPGGAKVHLPTSEVTTKAFTSSRSVIRRLKSVTMPPACRCACSPMGLLIGLCPGVPTPPCRRRGAGPFALLYPESGNYLSRVRMERDRLTPNGNFNLRARRRQSLLRCRQWTHILLR